MIGKKENKITRSCFHT